MSSRPTRGWIRAPGPAGSSSVSTSTNDSTNNSNSWGVSASMTHTFTARTYPSLDSASCTEPATHPARSSQGSEPRPDPGRLTPTQNHRARRPRSPDLWPWGMPTQSHQARERARWVLGSGGVQRSHDDLANQVHLGPKCAVLTLPLGGGEGQVLCDRREFRALGPISVWVGCVMGLDGDPVGATTDTSRGTVMEGSAYGLSPVNSVRSV